jgi:wyosine [tRNA(Phe)-imidazoG37] synthetase (radical SAM superfamily)
VARTLDFQDHRRDLGTNRYIYAVVSRRARGLSIGVNLNPDKVCNFDCPYCQVDRTVPGGPADIDLDVLEAELDRLLGWVADGSLWLHPPFDTVAPELRRVADIAFAGDGEPTTPAAFPGAVERVRLVRARYGLDGAGPAPRVPVRLLTNATMLHRARVQPVLGHLDEVWAKLDAGTEAWFRKVDGTTFPFARVLSNLAATAAALPPDRPLVLQSMFCAFDGVGPDDAEIDAWLARIDAIAAAGPIGQVQIYTVARKPAESAVGPLPKARLDAIAERVRARGIAAESYGGV